MPYLLGIVARLSLYRTQSTDSETGPGTLERYIVVEILFRSSHGAGLLFRLVDAKGEAKIPTGLFLKLVDPR